MITKNQIYQLLWTTEDKGYLTDQIFALIQQSQQWQPIETAPRDGTWFWGYSEIENVFSQVAWSNLHENFMDLYHKPIRLSCWQPLPKPPEKKGAVK